MRTVLKAIFNFLIESISVTDNFLLNCFVMTIIGEVSASIAYRAGGSLFDCGYIESRSMGSILHWTIRLFAYAVGAWLIQIYIMIFC